jgi:hypothetical protein
MFSSSLYLILNIQQSINDLLLSFDEVISSQISFSIKKSTSVFMIFIQSNQSDDALAFLYVFNSLCASFKLNVSSEIKMCRTLIM